MDWTICKHYFGLVRCAIHELSHGFLPLGWSRQTVKGTVTQNPCRDFLHVLCAVGNTRLAQVSFPKFNNLSLQG